MTLGELISPVTALLRLITSFYGRQSARPHKRLEGSILLRGIVAEVPEELPFFLCDIDGNRHRGIYVIGMLIWNKGTQPVTQADILPSAPLQVTVDPDSTFVNAQIIPIEDQTDCSATVISPTTLRLDFDCINPNEYLIVPIYYTGNPMTKVQITGRIIGQEYSIDHTAAEVKAAFFERLTVLAILLMLLNTIPGLLVAGGYILHDYGLGTMWHDPNSIPTYLMIPFAMGVMTSAMFIISRIIFWFERKKYPEGYPLYGDLEPPLFENIKGMLRTVLKGEKYRVSTSLFDWGKPILLTAKKTKRRTIDDWIR
ncbi:hypothetical protein AB7M29_005114 [Pseudomonas sp. F-14 TE3623]